MARETLVVALGGNALLGPGQQGTVAEQFANLKKPLRQLARLSRDYRLVITHGNGPQVGNLLLQQECCAAVPQLPLEILVAQTQGQIGYMIESVLDGELARLGREEQLLASLLSYVVVDPADPAFAIPTKPIGPFYDAEAAARLPWPTVVTPKGHRRVVASPRPVTIVEKREIAALVAAGFIVICCGGGGIPVIRRGRGFHGVDAVIDKDLASAVLAGELAADRLIIATDVPGAAIAFGTPAEHYPATLTAAEAERHLAAGQFPAGSMGPKVEAALRVVRSGGRAAICHRDDIERAAADTAGTRFIP